MSNLISGKEALIALANGEEVEIKMDGNWLDCDHLKATQIYMVIDDYYKFRLKPKTILINGVEVPAPFKPKDGDRIYSLYSLSLKGYESLIVQTEVEGGLVWRTEDEIKQVVEALRKVFNQGEVV